MHIYDWIDLVVSKTAGEARARAFLDLKTRSAYEVMQCTAPIKNAVITCEYRGNTYRITGASRFGDVWLQPNIKQEHGYKHRVNIEDCSNFHELIEGKQYEISN